MEAVKGAGGRVMRPVPLPPCRVCPAKSGGRLDRDAAEAADPEALYAWRAKTRLPILPARAEGARRSGARRGAALCKFQEMHVECAAAKRAGRGSFGVKGRHFSFSCPRFFGADSGKATSLEF